MSKPTLVTAGVIMLLLVASTVSSIARTGPVKDSQITFWVKRALRDDPRVGSADIDVSTDGGIVTLSGTAKDLASKQFAEAEAKKVQGVVGVINEVAVQPMARRDDDISRDVRRRIDHSVFIEPAKIKVTTVEGKVTLAGSVASWGELQEAGILASEVRGVKTVGNNLRLQNTSGRRDNNIGRDVLGALRRDVYLSGLPIRASVDHGLVTLKGIVPTSQQRRVAERDAGNVVGVGWVSDSLDVVNVHRQDQDVRSDVVFDIDSDYALADQNIKVAVQDAEVTLSGEVNTTYEKTHAEEVAFRVRGVAAVLNQITIKREVHYSDKEVAQKIQERLKIDWFTTGASNKIRVQVKDGVVMLTGTVDSWAERKEASEVARHTEGVSQVVNRVAVGGYNYLWQ